MRWSRVFDIALGASAISWAALGLLRVPERPLEVRLGVAALNLLVGVLFLSRRSPIAEGSARAIASALPSMALAAAAVRFADGPWPLAARALFLGSALAACACLATLGRSFAFLPSRRALVVRGPYRLVRHPVYLSELGMLVACAIARPWPGALLAAGALLTLVLRIRAEEQLLADDPRHAAYRAQVRWRVVPGVY